jgi:hypothetical protein
MKKLLLLSYTLLIGLVSISQTTVTTVGFNSCYWNDTTQRFDIECQYRYLSESKFSFNECDTIFTQTTPEMSSTYYIDSTDHKVDYDRQVWVYYVTSGMGNRYVYFFDIKNDEIRFLPWDGSYIVYAKIKNIWDNPPSK